MTTDDERREVARNIRENYVRDGLGYKIASSYNIAMAVGIVPELTVGDIELWNRLADLIEPSEGQNGPDASVDSGCGTRVDRDALLALADNLDSSASMLLKQNDLDPNRKRRGIRRDYAQGLMAASGRIREALGVSCDA